jgi:hypothetical protein
MGILGTGLKIAGKITSVLGVDAAKKGAEAAFGAGEDLVNAALKIGAGVTKIGDEVYEWGKDAYDYIQKIIPENHRVLVPIWQSWHTGRRLGTCAHAPRGIGAGGVIASATFRKRRTRLMLAYSLHVKSIARAR